jgi:hypothetical protein
LQQVPAPPFESIVTPATPRSIPSVADLIRRVDRGAFQGDKFAVQFLTNHSTKSRHVAINLAEVQPSAGGPSFHIHAFDQFYYVIEGSMTVDVGLNKYEAGVMLVRGVRPRRPGARRDRVTGLLDSSG